MNEMAGHQESTGVMSEGQPLDMIVLGMNSGTSMVCEL